MTLKEIETRLAQIKTELDTEGADIEALSTEADNLIEERRKFEARAKLLNKIAAGAGTVVEPIAPVENEEEKRANKFVETRRASVPVKQVRSTLISSGKLATPTGVSGINELVGSRVSSIIDMVKIVDCSGMGANKVAYLDTDMAAAAAQTEGSAVTATDPTFGYVEIKPASIRTMAQISEQVKAQTPLLYREKVVEQAMLALRKKAAELVTAALKSSTLVHSNAASLDNSKKGVINDKTLRALALAYGGDESVVGEAVLFLNKIDLIAFGDVRGTNEKKAVYEITPDTANPNTGTIKDGGLVVRYCLNSNLTALAGTAQTTTAAQPTMFYGNPQCLELDLFKDYTIRTSDDFAIDKGLETIIGASELGAGVVVKNGFVTLTIAKGTA
nr:MAG TPA: major capsid protein [Caudoviricetes sp.]